MKRFCSLISDSVALLIASFWREISSLSATLAAFGSVHRNGHPSQEVGPFAFDTATGTPLFFCHSL
jgi:hypothetical protein